MFNVVSIIWPDEQLWLNLTMVMVDGVTGKIYGNSPTDDVNDRVVCAVAGKKNL